jgi:hypothetical protein
VKLQPFSVGWALPLTLKTLFGKLCGDAHSYNQWVIHLKIAVKPKFSPRIQTQSSKRNEMGERSL